MRSWRSACGTTGTATRPRRHPGRACRRPRRQGRVQRPKEGRILYAAFRALPLPAEPVARLWHAATLLREHRGDGHIAALVAAGIGRTEAHVLHALSENIRAAKFERVHQRIESPTDDLAAPAYSSLEPSELDQLIAYLQPVSATLNAAGSR